MRRITLISGVCLGGIEPGETAQAAIQREFTEELSWNIGEVSYLTSYADQEVFYARTSKTVEELRPQLREGDDLGFFSEADIATIDVAEPHLSIIKNYFASPKPTVVQLVCRGNACRGILAQAYLRSLKRENMLALSSGSVAAAHKDENAKRYSEARDLLQKHGLLEFAKQTHAEQLTQEMLDMSDIVVCVNQRVFDGCEQLFTLPENTIYWDITDIGETGRSPKNPAELQRFEEDTYNEIVKAVDELITTKLS